MAGERVTRQIGAVQLQSLTPLQVEGLYATLLERGGAGGRALAPKTVRNCHIVLRRALTDAERLGLVTRNPAAAAKAVSAPRSEQKTWSSEEIQRFFDAVAGERLSMAFVLLATTGMRTMGPIFFGVEGGRMDRYCADRMVKRLVKRAGIDKRISPHSLRHSFITAALDAGVPLRYVQEAASHADPRTTMRYDRARRSLDRHATYIVSTFIAGDSSGLTPRRLYPFVIHLGCG
jgi:integrase